MQAQISQILSHHPIDIAKTDTPPPKPSRPEKVGAEKPLPPAATLPTVRTAPEVAITTVSVKNVEPVVNLPAVPTQLPVIHSPSIDVVESAAMGAQTALPHRVTSVVSPAPTAQPASTVAQVAALRSPAKPLIPAHWLTGEFWLNKIGIALLLFGIAFFFNYAIELGWVVPPLRVAAGLLVGGLMLGLGLRLNVKAMQADSVSDTSSNLRETAFPQVLMAGGIVTFFITGYASLKFYDLVSYPVAFAFMTLVTVFAYVLAVRNNSVTLAVIALSGGLLTPVTLSNGNGDVSAWLAYNALMIGCAAMLYMWRGWQVLLWSAAISASLIPVFAAISQGYSMAVQLFIVFMLFVFWALPILRRWLVLQPISNRVNLQPLTWPNLVADTKLLALGSVALTIVTTGINWKMSAAQFGWFTLGAALFCATVVWTMGRIVALRVHFATHVLMTAILLITAAAAFAPIPDWVLLALSLLTVLLLWLHRSAKTFTPSLRWIIYVALGSVFLWTSIDLILQNFDLLRNIAVLSGIGVLILAALWETNLVVRRAYFISIYGLLCLWLMNAFNEWPYGAMLASFGIGLLGLITFAISVWKQQRAWRITGYCTLLLATAKMISFDIIMLPRLASQAYGLEVIGIAILFALAAAIDLYTQNRNDVWHVSSVFSVLFGLWGIYLISQSNTWVMFGLVIMSLILHIASFKSNRAAAKLLHVIFHICALCAGLMILMQLQYQLLLDSINTWITVICIGLLFVHSQLLRFSDLNLLSKRSDYAVYASVPYALGVFWLGQLVHQFGYKHILTTASWGIVGLAIVVVSFYRKTVLWQVAGLLTLVVAVAKLCLLDTDVLSPEILSGLMFGFALICAGVAWLYRAADDKLAKAVFLLAVLSALILLNWAVAYLTEQAIWATLTLGMTALILIVYGLRYTNAVWRSIGFVTLAIMIAKIFLVDLSETDLFSKMIVFSIMGVALLALSYFYRKLQTPMRKVSQGE
ncbi:MAG: DUF2339 domain-containing protein [Anaerolineae bacterium]|nr:DUF2339 domain-containing protein [Anaerolineae bacterium]